MKKIDQADLARGINISPSTVSKWWNNKQVPGAKNTRRLAVFFGCSEIWLNIGEGPIFPNELVVKALSSLEKISSTVDQLHQKYKLPSKLARMMQWANAQEEDLDYWAILEHKFAQEFPEYKEWLKLQAQEKKEATGTDN